MTRPFALGMGCAALHPQGDYMTITCSMDHERRYKVAIASGEIALEDVRRHCMRSTLRVA
jgi:hypothetical protein